MIWLAPAALFLGWLLGLQLPITLPLLWGRYFSIALLAALDASLGGLRASIEKRFDTFVFTTGFFANATLAGLLVYVGDRLGVPLYYAALFAFGFRIFTNLGVIRRAIIRPWRFKDIATKGHKKEENKSQ